MRPRASRFAPISRADGATSDRRPCLQGNLLLVAPGPSPQSLSSSRYQRESGSRLLEIGCGTGANLRERRSRWTSTVGIDLELRALAYCRDLVTVQADALEALPFADTTFDVVVLLDVLEHLANPGNLVREMSRVLRQDGAVVIMVPAGPELWSYWDEMHGHQRRYTKATLASVFGAGLEARDAGV